MQGLLDLSQGQQPKSVREVSGEPQAQAKAEVLDPQQAHRAGDGAIQRPCTRLHVPQAVVMDRDRLTPWTFTKQAGKSVGAV